MPQGAGAAYPAGNVFVACPADERAVEMSEIVKGYEYARDQYVILTEEDFEKLPLPSKHTIELTQFVEAEEIDPVYYEKSYYLEADERAMKPYSLLLKALREKGLVYEGRLPGLARPFSLMDRRHG